MSKTVRMPFGPELAMLLELPSDTCEMALALEHLQTTADERFPAEELRRYICRRYGLSTEQFKLEVDLIENRSELATTSWAETATSEITSEFDSNNVKLLESPSIIFSGIRMLAEVTIHIGEISDREVLLRVIRCLRNITCGLTKTSERRTVGALQVTLQVFTRLEKWHQWHLCTTTINAETATAAATKDERQWLSFTGTKLNPVHADFLVRALKPKLYALRLANSALDLINTRLIRRK